MKTLVLASTSRYRRNLLDRLGLPYATLPPNVDETPEPGEHPATLAARLAAGKARTGAVPGTLVIGADQVAALEGESLGKPGTHAAALAQLESCQGKTVIFHTAVAVYDVDLDELHEHIDLTRVTFSELERWQLEQYLAREPAFDCAGGFKVEGLGVALFDAVESKDPTALVGLPLIWLSHTLRRLGLDPLAAAD
jgi:septum formation protein